MSSLQSPSCCLFRQMTQDTTCKFRFSEKQARRISIPKMPVRNKGEGTRHGEPGTKVHSLTPVSDRDGDGWAGRAADLSKVLR